jgi:hypothetical protein
MGSLSKVIFGAPGVDQLFGKKASRLLRDPLGLVPRKQKIKPEPRVDQEAAEAADRERRRRSQEGARKTVLTGPLGATEQPYTRRTVLSGG